MMKILLADDHPILRKGLRLLISEIPDTMIVAEAEDGEDALTKIRHYRPDVVFIDISMPYKNGLEVIKTIKKEMPGVDFVVLSAHNSIQYYHEAIDAGASAYLSKGIISGELEACLDALRNGKEYVGSSMKTKINETTSGLQSLTTREIEILRLLIDGKTNREIAEELFCSEKNVEKIKTNIRKKLDIPSSYGALLSWAIKNKVFL